MPTGHPKCKFGEQPDLDGVRRNARCVRDVKCEGYCWQHWHTWGQFTSRGGQHVNRATG